MDETQDITDVKYYEDIVPSGAATNAKIQEIGTPAKRNHFYKTFYYDKAFKKVKQTWEECPFISRDSLVTTGSIWSTGLLAGISGSKTRTSDSSGSSWIGTLPEAETVRAFRLPVSGSHRQGVLSWTVKFASNNKDLSRF